VPKSIALLGIFLQTILNWAMALTNASCVLTAAKGWVGSPWMPFFKVWREL